MLGIYGGRGGYGGGNMRGAVAGRICAERGRGEYARGGGRGGYARGGGGEDMRGAAVHMVDAQYTREGGI